MIKITDMVREVISSSEVASEALEMGILNMSAYAKLIKPKVAEFAKKPVKVGSIVAALARMEGKIEKIVPDVEVLDMTVKAPLIEIVYERSKSVAAGIREVYDRIKIGTSEYVAVTQGADEINILVSEKEKNTVLDIFKTHKPKVQINNLVAVSVRFDAKYITVPNVIYALIRKLAVKKINIIEIISTYTELAIIIDRKDLEKAMGVWS